MSFQADFLSELLFAKHAHKTFRFTVYPHMLRQTLVPHKTLQAYRTFELLFTRMTQSVIFHTFFRLKLQSAAAAYKVIIRMRQFIVIVEQLPRLEYLSTFGTCVRCLRTSVSQYQMFLLMLPRQKPFTTIDACERPTSLGFFHVFPLVSGRRKISPTLSTHILTGMPTPNMVFQSFDR